MATRQTVAAAHDAKGSRAVKMCCFLTLGLIIWAPFIAIFHLCLTSTFVPAAEGIYGAAQLKNSFMDNQGIHLFLHTAHAKNSISDINWCGFCSDPPPSCHFLSGIASVSKVFDPSLTFKVLSADGSQIPQRKKWAPQACVSSRAIKLLFLIFSNT